MFDRIEFTRGAAALTLISAGAALALAGCASGAQLKNVSAPGGVTVSTSRSAVAVAPSASTVVAVDASGGASAGASTVGPGGQPTATTTAGGVPECRIGELAISLGPDFSSGAPGVSQRPIIFKNTGTATCFVVGFPGVAALDGGGSQIYQAARVNSEGPKVTLQPGESASALLATVNLAANPCPSVPALLVTPPDETHSARVSFGRTVCVAPTITTLAPGTNGGDTTQAQTQFSEAQQLWKTGATATSVDQGSYWQQAASLLTNAVQSGAPGTAGFTEAAQELTQLVSLPDAMQSAAQQAESIHDVTQLNIFFGTPGLYS
jgi:hypothetical protein